MSASSPNAGFIYDAVAYPSPIFPAQSPDCIAAAGLLHGWQGPDPLTASVLEIGCGDGLNLTAIAASAPGSRCIGFDLSASAIETGRELIAAAGLKNIELQQGDILTYPRDGEGFDYILVHGVYAWVPDFVRKALIELIGARLAPGGVAYVSYDCLPGAAGKYAINRFLRARVGHLKSAQEQVEAASRLIANMARNQGAESRLATDLGRLVGKSLNPAYFFHDWLAEYYAPATVREVATAFAGVGLAIAGDVGLSDLYSIALDEDANALLAAEPGIAGRQELIDMLTGDTVFRRSLLVRRDAPPAIVADALRRLRFAFLGAREEVEGPGDVVRYEGRGSRLEASSSPHQQLMGALNAASPGELTFDDLLAATGMAEPDLDRLVRTLSASGLIECHATPQNFVVAPGERPRAAPLIRAMVARGTHGITPRHLRSNDYPEATRVLVTLCDGTRTRTDLAAEISKRAGTEVPLSSIETAIAAVARDGIFEA